MSLSARRLLRDNGRRSFVPPCFKWDVVDPESGAVVEVASEVDLSPLEVSEDETARLYSELARSERVVEGRTVPYEVGTSGEKGLRFVVVKLLDHQPQSS